MCLCVGKILKIIILYLDTLKKCEMLSFKDGKNIFLDNLLSQNEGFLNLFFQWGSSF